MRLFFDLYQIKMKVEFDSIIENMKVQKENAFLPMDVAIKYYRKWDCDILCQIDNSIYYKCLNGVGNVEFLNGNSYSGSFKNGFMHGKGIYKWKNGLVYEGQFANNILSGEGKLQWPNGNSYIGSVLDGKRHGNGQFYCATDKSNYKGLWSQGVKDGKGTLCFSNGGVYQGDFKNGLRQGKGKMRYQSGNQYDGQWKGDKKEGFGVMNWYSTFQKYEGDWKNDVPSGWGSYFWFQGKLDNKSIKTIYKGQWKAGKRDGFGTFFYNNGCRLQGTFNNNLKDGVCYVVDEYGEGHLQTFKNDKSVLKKEEIALKEDKKHFKLPEISQSRKQNILQNNEPADNNYPRFVDFQNSLIDEPIYNVLLRQNSQLRQWFKTLINNLNKQVFNGLSIEGLWRLIRDMKLADDTITLAKLNRQFFSGYKSRFEVNTINKSKLQLIRKNANIINKNNYYTLQWQLFFDEASKTKLDWNQWQAILTDKNTKIKDVNLNRQFNLHSNHHIILFRHFVVYILHLALIQHNHFLHQNQPISFRKCLEDLFTSIKIAVNPINNLSTEKNCSQKLTNASLNTSKLHISEEYSAINQSLFDRICKNRPQLLNVIDKTITVKQVYCLLCQTGHLKEASQKMLFLQKIQRNMNVKMSLLKKENKNYYQSFEKVALKSPHFSHILNYQMIESEFDEILYVFLNRKIGNTQSKEQFLKKYKEIIKNLTSFVENIQEEQKKQSSKQVKFNYKRVSAKDREKQQLLKRIEEQRQRKIKEELAHKQLLRQQRQRKLMKKEDFDIKDEDLSEQSEGYYD